MSVLKLSEGRQKILVLLQEAIERLGWSWPLWDVEKGVLTRTNELVEVYWKMLESREKA